MDNNLENENFVVAQPRRSALKILGLAAFGALLITTGFAGVFLFQNLHEKEHLILHVPYKGQYNGSLLSTQAGTSAYSILTYWGDERFSADQLVQHFPFSTSEDVRIDLPYVADFFSDNGYETEIITLDGGVEQFVSYIDENIPVLVEQLLASDAPKELTSQRLLIGYSNKNRELVFHDNNFGNNYVMPFDEFYDLSTEFVTRALVITPGAEIRSSLKGPDSSYKYPERLGIMDDEGLRRIQIKWMMVNFLKFRFASEGIPGATEATRLLNEIISDEAFKRLHPAARMDMSYNLSGFYMGNLDEPEKAIEVLENVTLPLIEAYDFGDAFGEWEREDPSIYERPYWNSIPWERLGHLYVRIGNKEKARSAFQKALEYYPGNTIAREQLQLLGF